MTFALQKLALILRLLYKYGLNATMQSTIMNQTEIKSLFLFTSNL